MEKGQKNPKKLEHLEIVTMQIIEGRSRAEILRYATENNWDLHERTISTYIREAKIEIRKIFREKISKRVDLDARQFLRYELLYKRAVDMLDFELARKIVESENKLLYGKDYNFTKFSAFARKIELEEKEFKAGEEQNISFNVSDQFEQD